MQKESGIILPEKISQLVVKNEHESYKRLYCRIPKQSAGAFAQKFNYTEFGNPRFQHIDCEGLPVSYKGLPRLVYASDASDYTAWDSVLSLDTGELWLAVECPDFAGDLPRRALKFEPK
jgi:hypothetical protein